MAPNVRINIDSAFSFTSHFQSIISGYILKLPLLALLKVKVRLENSCVLKPRIITLDNVTSSPKTASVTCISWPKYVAKLYFRS